MKNKYTKPEDFKINADKTENAKCRCIDKGEILPHCLETGICPTLKIISVHKGFKWAENGKVKKEFEGLEKVITVFRKIFEAIGQRKYE